MQQAEYHKKIVEYYHDTRNAYKDSWDMDNSLAIHYGYWDDTVRTFPQSLLRMNEIMMQSVGIRSTDHVLDAGCGVGGSSIYLATRAGCKVTGITISMEQQQQATANASSRNVAGNVSFHVMDYCNTSFPDASFDVVWGCESICYATDKEQFINEAWRILKPGGRLVAADGFVTKFENNKHPTIRHWLDGWQVNYLETPERFENILNMAGFQEVSYRDISEYTTHSSRRLYRLYFLASLYLTLKKLVRSNRATDMQKKNIRACKFQYLAMKKNLWQYGIITGIKP